MKTYYTNICARVNNKFNEIYTRIQDKASKHPRLVRVFLFFVFVITMYIAHADFGTPVQEIYIVQPGDTIYSIAAKYVEKNTSRTKYILDMQYEIVQDNPQVKQNKYLIHPGDQLIINYKVK